MLTVALAVMQTADGDSEDNGKGKASFGRAKSSYAMSNHSLLSPVPVSDRHQGSW